MRSTLQRVCELILSIKDNKTLWQQIQIWFQATINRNFRWSSLWSRTMSSRQVLNSSRASERMKREKRLENAALNLDFSFWNFCDANWRERSAASVEAQTRMGENSPNNVLPAEPVETIPEGVNKQRNCCPLGILMKLLVTPVTPASTRLAWAGQRCELDAHLNCP